MLQEMIDWPGVAFCWIADRVAKRNGAPYMARFIKNDPMIDEEIFRNNE